MATFTIDLLTGNLYLFNGDFTGSGSTPTSGSTYPEVNVYASLPSASTSTGKIYVVRNATGEYIYNRKDSGLYYSNGTTWSRLGDIPSYFNSNNFQVYDDSDPTKGIKFITSGITTNNFRKITVQDSDGTLAYLTDINAKVDATLFNEYTGITAPNTYLNLTTFDIYTGITETRLSKIENDIIEISGMTGNYLGNGVVTGLTISRNELDSGLTSINISSGVGYFVDSFTNPEYPVSTKFTFTGQTGITIQNISSGLTTYIAIDINGNIIQQQTEFTPEQRRDYIILGIVIHTNLTIINGVNNLPDVELDTLSQLNDFFDAFKNFNVNGNIFSPNGANLKLNKSEGKIFKRGVNFTNNIKNPHIITLLALNAPFTIRYRLSDGTEYGDTDSVSLFYENPLGTRVALPSTGYTVQRITIFPSNSVRIQYGQGVYSTMGLAMSSIYSEDFVEEENIKENGLLRAYLIIKGSVTSLLNENDAYFIEADRFGKMPKGAGDITIGLQRVTETEPRTNIETTFGNGIILNKLKPVTDSISAITINKTDNNPLIIIDSISGQTGFGIQPNNKVHLYGTDNSEPNYISTQKNGIIIDGVSDGDKDVIWADNGINKWFAEIYRNEAGKFWYLYSEEAQSSPITISETGRLGINSITNIIDYPPTIVSGTSYGGLLIGGLYSKNLIQVYEVQINSVSGNPNTYIYRISKDLGQTYGDWSTPTGCTTGITYIDGDVEISFAYTTGFSFGDTWRFTAFPQLAPATVSIDNTRINKALLTYDYSTFPNNTIELTAEINSSSQENPFPLFQTGTTLNAAYVGNYTEIDSIFVGIIEAGSGVTLIIEYWNGSSWIDISIGTDYYNDGTNNLTQTGVVTWDSYQMTDWVADDIDGSGEVLYWIRVRTISAPSKTPLLSMVTRGSQYRNAVYASPLDAKPAFYIDALGRVNIGGGNISGKNVLQINKSYNVPPSTSLPSLVEIDSEDSEAIDLRIRLSSNDNIGGGINIGKTRGTLANPTTVQINDELGHLSFRGVNNNLGFTAACISTKYYGDGNNNCSDLILYSSNATSSIESIRMNGNGIGIMGITSPSAKMHLPSGSTSIGTSPLKFTNGQLLSIPEDGAIEYNGNYWFGTISGNTRKTFAFLESPVFVGSPALPSGTTLNNLNLFDFINYSAATYNDLLTQKAEFDTYTGATDLRLDNIDIDIINLNNDVNTKLPIATFSAYTGTSIPWSQLDLTTSNLADLTTRNASDVNISVSNWDSTNVNDIIQKISEYNEDTLVTGRIEPNDVLFGRLTNTLIVSGGSGYINYEGFHKKIVWSGTTFDTSSGYTEGIYYVYVDSNGDVNITSSEPDSYTVITLGSFFWGGLIGVIQQCGCTAKSSINNLINSIIRQGIFIYDNGGNISTIIGDELRIISSQAKIQYGILDAQLPEVSSYDATGFTFLNYFKSVDYGWAINYYFNIGSAGRIPINRWNDVTKTSNNINSGFTFTFGSNIVTGSTELTGLTDAFIYLQNDTDVYMTPVTGTSWNGSVMTLSLKTPYYGAGGTGNMVSILAIPRLPADKHVKHLIVRSSDGLMYLILGQMYYDTYDEALAGVLPALPSSLEPFAIKMAYIITNSGTTSLNGNIYDIRPLPYQYREGGQVGGGTTITVHGDLSGLGADDHLQYLRTDGTRNITGIQRYQSHPTFTTTTDLVDKKYVDDADILKLNVTTFNSFTGTTLPNNYLTISNFNTYTGITDIRLNNIENDINTISGETNNKLDSSIFNTYTGTTIPTNYYNKTEINSYTAQTLNNINSRLLITDFNLYTGTTIPTNYYNKTEINSYTASTNTLINTKAPLISPALTGTPTAPTAIVNTSTTQIATTAYVVGQAANVNPLMDGLVAIGSSLRYARQDHIHPTDTSRVAKTGDTMTGALNINSNLTVTGNVNVSGNSKINGNTYLGNVTPDVNQQNFSVIDITTKKVADSGTKFHVYGTEFYYAQNLAGTTTTVVTPTYETKTSITTAVVPAGTYKITASWQFNNNSTNRDMLSKIQVDGTDLGSFTNFELGDAASYLQTSRVLFITFATAASHTIALQFSNELAATLTIYDQSLEFVRVS